ncbi:hypothetical protein TWF191_000395 [Orbilia oligospora]|uniref:Uncharacterized protein n=1 Tax=Orbilia oligospora TaxID=2813651 RepID=A0A7C8QED2_ORBOL|nr:hypothetical protein TWF191_000395 [Orbilia oligospora]
MLNSGRQGHTKIAGVAIFVLLILWLYKLNAGNYLLPTRESTVRPGQENVEVADPEATLKVEEAVGTAEAGATSTPIPDVVESPVTPSEKPTGGKKHEKTVIMGKTYKEDATWVKEKLPDWRPIVYAVDSRTDKDYLHVLVNKGKESMPYLTYLIDFYDDLSDINVFIHAHENGYPRAWHNDPQSADYSAVKMLELLRLDNVREKGYVNLRCNPNPGCPADLHPQKESFDKGRIEIGWRKLWGHMHGNNLYPESVGVACCAQFAVTRERIHEQPKEYYEKLMDWLLTTDEEDAGRVFEYFWHMIFGMPAVHSLSHAFLLAQTLQPRDHSGEITKDPVVDPEVYEDPGPDPNNIIVKPSTQPLRFCNLRTSFSKYDFKSTAKVGGRWDKMGDPTTIRYLVAANWGGSLPLEAIAFYSSDNCEEKSLVMMIRFFVSEDSIQIVRLIESYVPGNLVAWQAVSIQNPGAVYSNRNVAALASSMTPGSIYIPVPGQEPMTANGELVLDTQATYCLGLVHRALFNNYNLANLRKTGMLDIRNLYSRVKYQIKSAELPKSTKYNFRCVPVLSDEDVDGYESENEALFEVNIKNVPPAEKGEYMVNSIVASDFPWDEGVDPTQKRSPDEIVKAILDLDRFDVREQFSTVLKGALNRLSGIQLEKAAASKRYPAISPADLDTYQREEDNQNNIVVPIPRRPKKQRLETIPQGGQRAGRVGKKIINLLGDATDPFGLIGIDTKLLESQHSFLPQRPDMRKQDYVFEKELFDILKSFGPRQRFGARDSAVIEEEGQHGPASVSPSSDGTEIVKEIEYEDRIEEEPSDGMEDINEELISPALTTDYNPGRIDPSISTPGLEDTKEEEDYSTRARYEGEEEEEEVKQEEPQATEEDVNVEGSVKAEYEDSVIKEEEPEQRTTPLVSFNSIDLNQFNQ